MPLFYDRTESQTEIKIAFRRGGMLLPLLIFFAAGACLWTVSSNDSPWFWPIVLAVFILMVASYVGHRRINREINAATSRGKYVKYTGRKYSFTNPVKVIISKSSDEETDGK